MLGPEGRDSFADIFAVVGKKLKKLNSGGYRICEHNQLLVYSPIYASLPMRIDALETLCNINQGYEARFETVFIAAPRCIFVFDLKQSRLRGIPLGSDTRCEPSIDAQQEITAVSPVF